MHNKKGNQGCELIADPCIAKLFEGKNSVFLAILLDDVSPQVIPIGMDIDKNNNRILINFAKGRINVEAFQKTTKSMNL
jgi:hypothetical protein